MRRHIEKLEIYYENSEWFRKCYNFKVLQVIYQGVIVIALGASVVSNPKECSSPIQVFLVGLFGLYLAGLIINFGVGFSRWCKAYVMTGLYKPTIEGIVKGVDLCYIPIYLTFSIFEFIWYIIGSVWYFESSDCSSEYSQGATFTIALLVVWYIFMAISIIFFIGVNWYVHSIEVVRNPPKEQQNQNPDIKVNQPPYPGNQPYFPGSRAPYWAQENTYPQTPANQSYYDSRGYDPRYSGANDPRYQEPRYPGPYDSRYPDRYDQGYGQGYEEDYNRYPDRQSQYPPEYYEPRYEGGYGRYPERQEQYPPERYDQNYASGFNRSSPRQSQSQYNYQGNPGSPYNRTNY
ncbi:unnamed protein product [Blepharisma stoltei]|uniref:MARVEL domain-containing protein n=1 Tax=Blepharisma stoltei TaxID=1481888 RepID=A0AAU9K0B0_9CILI|nr:unnamed protein product [Blepharisma stoltei]